MQIKNFKTEIEGRFLNLTIPNITVGDTIKLGVSITEGNKERIQFTEGVIIAKKGSGLNATITLRRVMQGVGVERVYLVNSPKLKSLEILRPMEQVRWLSFLKISTSVIWTDLNGLWKPKTSN